MSGPRGRPDSGSSPLVPDLMDRSKVTARFPGAEIVGSAADLVEAVARLGDRERSAVLVLVDLGRPGVIDAVRQLRRAAPVGPGLHVVGFASHVDAATLDAAREAGVEALPRSVFFRRLEQGELLGTSAHAWPPADRDEGPGGVRRLLARTAELAADHLDALGERPVDCRRERRRTAPVAGWARSPTSPAMPAAPSRTSPPAAPAGSSRRTVPATSAS